MAIVTAATLSMTMLMTDDGDDDVSAITMRVTTMTVTMTINDDEGDVSGNDEEVNHKKGKNWRGCAPGLNNARRTPGSCVALREFFSLFVSNYCFQVVVVVAPLFFFWLGMGFCLFVFVFVWASFVFLVFCLFCLRLLLLFVILDYLVFLKSVSFHYHCIGMRFLHVCCFQFV